MKKIAIGILLAVIIVWMSGVTNDHYTIEEYQSPLVGQTFSINQPIAYIEGLEHCNDLAEPNAYNTDCILHPKVELSIRELVSECGGCLKFDDIHKPRRLIYKETSTLTVVGSYTFQPNFITDRLFDWKSSLLLVRDDLGNQLEVSEPFLELLKAQYPLNSDQRYLKQLYNNRRINEGINETMCFFPSQYRKHTQRIQEIATLINKLDLSERVTFSDYELCDEKYANGIRVHSIDFDSFFTLQYYLHSAGIYGTWQK
jgi:hypothetical protein